ncbi:MAG: DUF494 domain-containing protein [Gammaproteobacteria bacterium]|nr:DUF494 domain-containing protein [Gammaproteobacteria bacterium]MDH5727532.1 DUF494 domain-containing protein [Gammaproteobacteria bacterium]
MKQDVFEVLMYLLENYWEHDEIINPDQDVLITELESAGFARSHVVKALKWLDELAESRSVGEIQGISNNPTIRIFTDYEQKRLDVECRDFLLFLENLRVLDHASRELVIDRVMALGPGEVDLDQLKWVVLMVLFNQPGQEAVLTWMEDIVFDEQVVSLH